jgi:hypothetical protein
MYTDINIFDRIYTISRLYFYCEAVRQNEITENSNVKQLSSLESLQLNVCKFDIVTGPIA